MMTPLGAMSRSDLQINKNILKANSLNIFLTISYIDLGF